MPRNKDLKRRVRARMNKTGESYTAARANLLDRKSRANQADYAELAGLSEAAVSRATGQGWAWWVDTLDAAGATDLPHREIVRWVEANVDVSAWWCQSVVVGYERIRGLREIGQRRGGAFDANRSRTLPVPVDELYAAFHDGRRRRAWLRGLTWQPTTESPPRSIRLAASNGEKVALWFVAKGSAKSTVQIQHGGLADARAVERAKQAWGERLDALAGYLSRR